MRERNVQGKYCKFWLTVQERQYLYTIIVTSYPVMTRMRYRRVPPPSNFHSVRFPPHLPHPHTQVDSIPKIQCTEECYAALLLPL